MGVTYTNRVFVSIIDPLADLLVTEFGAGVPVRWDDEKVGGSEWIEVHPIGSELIERNACSESRVYVVELLYISRQGGRYGLNSLKNRLDAPERLHRLLSNYSQDGSQKWYDARVGAIEYDYELPEREDDKLTAVRIEWTAHATEALA
jgi:hypothetical protein